MMQTKKHQYVTRLAQLLNSIAAKGKRQLHTYVCVYVYLD